MSFKILTGCEHTKFVFYSIRSHIISWIQTRFPDFQSNPLYIKHISSRKKMERTGNFDHIHDDLKKSGSDFNDWIFHFLPDYVRFGRRIHVQRI